MTRRKPTLPTTYVAHLDGEALADLGADLATAAQAVTFRCDPPHDGALADALRELAAGRVRRVLVRYRHEGRRWCDTLLAASGGARLVRIEDPSPAPARQPPS